MSHDNLPLWIILGALLLAVAFVEIMRHPPKRKCVQCGKKVLARSRTGRCADCLNRQARGQLAVSRILDHQTRMTRRYKDRR